jgi:hypothetical protein
MNTYDKMVIAAPHDLAGLLAEARTVLESPECVLFRLNPKKSSPLTISFLKQPAAKGELYSVCVEKKGEDNPDGGFIYSGRYMDEGLAKEFEEGIIGMLNKEGYRCIHRD